MLQQSACSLCEDLADTTHSPGHALDRDIGLAKPDFGPATEEPCPCQVRVKQEGPFDKGVAVLDIARHPGESEAGGAESKGVIFVNSAARRANRLVSAIAWARSTGQPPAFCCV